MLGLALLPVASQAEQRLKVGAWLPYWDQDEATGSVRSERGIVEAASPFWFEARSDDDIASYPGARDPEILSGLRKAGIDVIPTITSSMTPAKVKRALGSPDRRRDHVRRVVAIAKSYDGIDLNYEYPALTTKRREAEKVRRVLNHTFSETCRALQRRDLICSVTVMPRTSDRKTVWRGKLIPWVYDYQRLGEVADRIRVMAYDQHAPGTGPGAIAPRRWVNRVARYAVSEAPPRKVELGVPLYGRDWPAGRSVARPRPPRSASGLLGGREEHVSARTAGRRIADDPGSSRASSSEVGTLTWRQAESLRREHGAKKRFSAKHGAPWFRYSGRTVWYSNGRSVGVQARIAKQLGMRGVYLWAPGAEDPKGWNVLQRIRR